MELLIVSGRSGSGKSVCLKALEDLGYNCTDNLPISLLGEFTKLYANRDQIAVGIDARNMPSNLLKFDEYISAAKQFGAVINIIYLDADDLTLIKRFSETRRRHPLTTDNISLQEAIALESSLLKPIANLANITMHTSNMSSHELKKEILNRLGKNYNNQLALLIQSFGYKNGIPTDADYVFDVRCLPNPYWDVNLRDFTGQDQQVIDFLSAEPLVKTMYESIIQFMAKWIPLIKANQRSYLTIALGCTGGQHRSVYLAEALGEYYKNTYPTLIRHREINKNFSL
ncbi:MAG: RNase adapter RapZ [Gammaproteobacteria bacterium]|nr:RNase adapter RapZ [Gammaproteobacteria bacterium]